jgi:hypothetical protein
MIRRPASMQIKWELSVGAPTVLVRCVLPSVTLLVLCPLANPRHIHMLGHMYVSCRRYMRDVLVVLLDWWYPEAWCTGVLVHCTPVLLWWYPIALEPTPGMGFHWDLEAHTCSSTLLSTAST